MSYQAVIRNSNNDLTTNTTVGMQISILQGSTGGAIIYIETHTPTSNINGLVSLEIGSGNILSGDIATIDWANGPYFIKTETDPTGGTNYTITGTSQLLSVPLVSNLSGTILPNYPMDTYEYGFKFNSPSFIHRAQLTIWNRGLIFYNIQPYLLSTDDATTGM